MADTSNRQPGMAPAPYVQPAYLQQTIVHVPTTNATAVASLVIAILSWFFCPVVGAILAVCLGVSANAEIRRRGQAGGAMATAGIVIGSLQLAIPVLLVCTIVLVAVLSQISH